MLRSDYYSGGFQDIYDSSAAASGAGVGSAQKQVQNTVGSGDTSLNRDQLVSKYEKNQELNAHL